MKKLNLLLLGAVLFTASCKKEDKCPYTDSNYTVPASEKTYLRDYVSTITPVPVEDSTGVFYTIVEPGTGATPSICSRLAVRYKGTFIPSGLQFDATVGTATASFQLGEVVPGWQKGIPKIKNGGKITLYIPPSLAYGPNDRTDRYGNVVIPGNSYLKFEVELADVQ